MKKLILTAAAAASLAMLSNAAHAQCMIYSEPNYQGAAGIIQPNDMVLFHTNETGDFEKRDRVFKDPIWLNNIKSSKVKTFCTLIIFEEINTSRRSRAYIGDTPKYKTDVSVAASCLC
jgi:hypothetical protein